MKLIGRTALLVTLVAGTTAFPSADAHYCRDTICGNCTGEDHCHGDFSFRVGCSCDITCYDWPENPADPWIETGDASCTPV